MEPKEGSLIPNYFSKEPELMVIIFKEREPAVLYNFKELHSTQISNPSKYIRAKMCFCGANNFSLL
jgi:hypothetical protein